MKIQKKSTIPSHLPFIMRPGFEKKPGLFVMDGFNDIMDMSRVQDGGYMNMKLVVLFGGASSEYSVSLQSAVAVMEALDPEKYEIIPVGISKDGKWFRYYGERQAIAENDWQKQECRPAFLSPDRSVHGLVWLKEDGTAVTEYVDAVFPVLHGKHGEDGTVQGLCELAGIPYVGCGTLSSALCMDKDLAHVAAKAAGVAVPGYRVLQSYMTPDEKTKACEGLEYPVFVKPARAGSSYGITKVSTAEQLEAAIVLAFEHDSKVVIEEAIDGFEVGCAVLGNQTLTVGEVDEIELHSDVFDFHEKYTLETSRIHVPARVSRKKAEEIKETARILYRALECQGMARVDMFLTPEGTIVFNEVNTIPGFTSHSRYPNMMKASGISFEQLLDTLVEEALAVQKNRDIL